MTIIGRLKSGFGGVVGIEDASKEFIMCIGEQGMFVT